VFQGNSAANGLTDPPLVVRGLQSFTPRTLAAPHASPPRLRTVPAILRDIQAALASGTISATTTTIHHPAATPTSRPANTCLVLTVIQDLNIQLSSLIQSRHSFSSHPLTQYTSSVPFSPSNVALPQIWAAMLTCISLFSNPFTQYRCPSTPQIPSLSLSSPTPFPYLNCCHPYLLLPAQSPKDRSHVKSPT